MTYKPKPRAAESAPPPTKLASLPTQVLRGRGGAIPTVQVNIRCSAEMAEAWKVYADQRGGQRVALAKLLKKEGLTIPIEDQVTEITKRQAMLDRLTMSKQGLAAKPSAGVRVSRAALANGAGRPR